MIKDKLINGEKLTTDEFEKLLGSYTADLAEELALQADKKRQEIYGKDVYVRGLIEFTNYCKNDCYYCGIRKSCRTHERYRLSEEEILTCAETGYGLGFRTFVLQGGEDPFFTCEKIEGLVKELKKRYPDCAVTLSVGEHPREIYERWFSAGADRYLLRHETINREHYSLLHPGSMSIENRVRCLYDLKDIGYQVGCGIMVGSPYQTNRHLAEDLSFIAEFRPHMVGMGPFIPAAGTPFENEKPGTLGMTLFLLSIVRLMLPEVLLPATTALGTIHPLGREKGIKAGANVVMPNLSPTDVRDKYMLYDNKICTGDEAAECKNCLSARMASIGYRLVSSRGDHAAMRRPE